MLPISKVISYNQFTCIELNESIDHIGSWNQTDIIAFDTDSIWIHPGERYKTESLKKVGDKVEYTVKITIHPKTPDSI